MTWWQIVLIVLGALILFIIVKALCFVDKRKVDKTDKPVKVDDTIVQDLGTLIKYKTVSYEDKSLIDFSVYQQYIDKVKTMFPKVFEKCEFKQTKEYAIFLKLKGKNSEKPTVLMAHYDVVPATEGWDLDPFLGEVVDGSLYGRGAVDTKCTMACALRALENALNKGYTPNNDLYLIFGANEEIFGDSQVKIVEELKKMGIKPALVFDEGGGITTNAFPGVKEDTAFLGVVEKGQMNVKLSYDGKGGHSSTPKKNGPIVKLSKVITRLEKHPMKPKFTPATKELINIMGRHSSFGLKIVFANQWLFSGLLKKLFMEVSADTRALLSTTFAFTIINGGTATNIIPNHVEANINVRLAPFDTVDDVIKHIKKVIKDDDIKVEVEFASKMYPECSFKSEGYNKIKDTIYKTYNNVVVAPFVVLGGTDGRHYNEISDCVIRFTPLKISNEERKGMHGLNEKIKVESLKKGLEFYENLLQLL